MKLTVARHGRIGRSTGRAVVMRAGVLASLVLLVLGAAGLRGQTAATSPAPALTEPAGQKTVTPSGLTIIVTSPSTGAQDGDLVQVLYTGKLTSGLEFDSSANRNNEPLPVKLGAPGIIKGWTEGIRGMQIGERRTLIIPPDLAYGPQGRGDKIPPNATLIFDIELVAITRGG